MDGLRSSLLLYFLCIQKLDTWPLVRLLTCPLNTANPNHLARSVLVVVNGLGIACLRSASSRRFGRLTGFCFTLITLSQFHLLFWMSRTLPNMFAFFPGKFLCGHLSYSHRAYHLHAVTFALSQFLNRAPQSTTRPALGSVRMAIGILTLTAVIFRAELVLLLAPYALQALLLRWISFRDLIKTGFVYGMLGLGTLFVGSR